MPNNLERQKVNIAIDIFRPDVIATLQMFAAQKVKGFEDVKGLITFLQTFQKWFALHDVSSTAEFIRKRLPDKMPYYSTDDERLTWLSDDFFTLLDDKWHKIIFDRLKKMPNISKDDKI